MLSNKTKGTLVSGVSIVFEMDIDMKLNIWNKDLSTMVAADQGVQSYTYIYVVCKIHASPPH